MGRYPNPKKVYATMLNKEGVAADTWYILVDLSDQVNYSHRGSEADKGTATAGASTTLTDGSQAWTVNGYANYHVEIYSGTGAGQIRKISSNTATVLTVSSAWTTNPSTDSLYRILGAVKTIRLLQLDIDAESIDDGDYDVWVGVVRENDATDGSADWVHVYHMQTFLNSTDSHGLRRVGSIDFTCNGANPDGLDCSIVGSRLISMRGPNSGNETGLQNDAANLDSAAGGSSLSAAVGDLVVWVEEVTGNTLDICLTAWYRAS